MSTQCFIHSQRVMNRTPAHRSPADPRCQAEAYRKSRPTKVKWGVLHNASDSCIMTSGLGSNPFV